MPASARLRWAVCLFILLAPAGLRAQAGAGMAGRPAPDFSLAALDGKVVHLAELRGHPVVINFWATWCPPCIHEMPQLAAIHAEHHDAGLVVVAINGDREKADVVARFIDKMALPFPVLLDPSLQANTRYGVIALPVTVFVDSAGMIRSVHAGPILPAELADGVRGILPSPQPGQGDGSGRAP